MSLLPTEHLTRAFDSDTEDKIKRTMPGMAHFGGTGPESRVCRECAFFRHELRYYAKGGKYGGKLKDAPCRKFSELMRNENGPPVPPTASACKYFEESPTPPALFQGRPA